MTSSERREERVFSRNNLDAAVSPYLQQHKDHVIHWQEWSPEALAHARATGKILLVSVGYSTCHWCHVMAAEAFSDPDIAAYLNAHFVAIKVDREERPDIDRFMMGFIHALSGQGGWPLNVFLSADLEPFHALTYAPVTRRFGMPGFLNILQQIKAFHDKERERLRPFRMEGLAAEETGSGGCTVTRPEQIDLVLVQQADKVNGGFQQRQKFPPHSSLLYGLYRLADGRAEDGLEDFVRLTLRAMCLGGLHDHLQGGFFRYCVDAQWTVPHFEKMLYDQALLLWNYALAARVFQDPLYRETAEGILRALMETFLEDDLFCSGHDADTGHREGSTYLWDTDELRQVLSPDDFAAFAAVFHLPPEGNFEGRIHLTRKANDPAAPEGVPLSPAQRDACTALLSVRNKRPQPFRDRKKLTCWNALTGIALLQAYRCLGLEDALQAAMKLRAALVERHVTDSGRVLRGSLDGALLNGTFLEDHAALLLFLTYAHEEDRAFGEQISLLQEGLNRFREGDRWIGSREADFLPVPAEQFDSPTPSEHALADLAAARAAMLAGKPFPEIPFGIPSAQDFQNVAALQTGGYAYLVTAPDPIPWPELPIHTVHIEGTHTHYCYKGTCVKTSLRSLPG